ncbi:MAG: hypothetical protein OEU95_02700 [Nitrospirota bacterium]|nr:hypothetical protein [Nitrospirota bacterium]
MEKIIIKKSPFIPLFQRGRHEMTRALTRRTVLSLLLLINLFLTISGCTKYEEPAPFFDGLYLEYKLSAQANLIYTVEAIGNDRFKIIETEKRTILNDEIVELLVDSHGIVYESHSKDYEGEFSPVWIPVHELEIGTSFDDGYTVLRKDKWKKWAVLVIKNPNVKEEQYFDINTGFLVGVKGSSGLSYEMVLTNTNAEIPVVGE